MNYLRISLLIAFGVFTLVCVNYANSKFQAKPRTHSAASCSQPEALSCGDTKSLSSRE